METNEKIQSQHGELQAMLPRILQTTPEWRPVFQSRDTAEAFLKRKAGQGDDDVDLHLHAVWAIDHSDLASSQVVGWSITEFMN